jgi:hypothetical protein
LNTAVVAVDATMRRSTLGAKKIRSFEVATAGQLTAIATSAIAHTRIQSCLANYARVDGRPCLNIALGSWAFGWWLHTFCEDVSVR